MWQVMFEKRGGWGKCSTREWSGMDLSEMRQESGPDHRCTPSRRSKDGATEDQTWFGDAKWSSGHSEGEDHACFAVMSTRDHENGEHV